MSDKTHNVTSLPETPETESDAAPKQNFFQRRIVTPIKEHPKTALAVAAGAALVAGAAFTGRKSAQYDVVLELQPAENEVDEVVLIDTAASND